MLTLDQRDSRRGEDRVPAMLDVVNAVGRFAILRAFERTAGDEIQGVVATSRAVVDVAAVLLRSQQWNVGLGLGAAEEPLPSSTRAGRGPAFVLAREAVTRAKRGPHHVAVSGEDAMMAEQVETVLWLLAATYAHRTAKGWGLVDKLDAGWSRAEAAAELAITPSAVAQRLRAAGWTEEKRARLLATQLLDPAGRGTGEEMTTR